MKVFRCGDVVPGCSEQLEGSDEEAVLRAVEGHARTAHGAALDDAVLAEVRSRVRSR